MSVDELVAMHDDGVERWLIRGELRGRPLRNSDASIQRPALGLATRLDRWQRERAVRSGEVVSDGGYVLRNGPTTAVRLPLAFLPTATAFNEDGWAASIPTVAVEVNVGPERHGDLVERVFEYLDCGVPLVWVLTPDNRVVSAHRFGDPARMYDSRHVLTGDPELPGFSVPVRDLFR